MNKWQRYRAKLKAQGLCQHCGGPRLPGYAVCADRAFRKREINKLGARRRCGWRPKQRGQPGRFAIVDAVRDGRNRDIEPPFIEVTPDTWGLVAWYPKTVALIRQLTDRKGA